MSSSAADGFRGFVVAALAAIESDRPRHAAAIARALGPRRVLVEIGADSFVLAAEGERAQVDDPELDPCPLRCHGADAAVVALVQGRLTLLGAIRSGALRIRGAVPDVVALHRALNAFLHGCVRTPRVAELFATYRGRHV